MLWKAVKAAKAFIGKCRSDSINAYAAQSAFFVMLSFIPFLMLFISLVKYTPISKSMVLSLVYQYTPDYISAFLISIIDEIYSRSVGLVSVTAIIAIWSAAKGVLHLSNGLNSVYDIVETRNYLYLRFRAVFDTLIFLVAVVMALALLVFGNSIQRIFETYIPVKNSITEFFIPFRTLITLFLFIVFFLVLYKALPNRKATFRSQLPGGVMAAIGWIILSFGFSVYIDYFNGFSMYGSLTTMVLVMLWLYFGMYILLICGEVNSIYEERWAKK